MKGAQCYELFGGIAPKNHAFSFFITLKAFFTTKKAYTTGAVDIMTI